MVHQNNARLKSALLLQGEVQGGIEQNKRLNMDLEILENKLNTISAKIQIIESLARVTLDAVRYGDNLKEIDKECLLIILNNRIKDLDIRMPKAIDQFY